MERVYPTAENGVLLGAAFQNRPLRGEASFLVPEDSTNAILNVKTGLSNFDKVELNF